MATQEHFQSNFIQLFFIDSCPDVFQWQPGSSFRAFDSFHWQLPSTLGAFLEHSVHFTGSYRTLSEQLHPTFLLKAAPMCSSGNPGALSEYLIHFTGIFGTLSEQFHLKLAQRVPATIREQFQSKRHVPMGVTHPFVRIN